MVHMSNPISIRRSMDGRHSQEDERPQLSQNTLDALNEFLSESQAASESQQKDPFAENWALSQVHQLLSCPCPALCHGSSKALSPVRCLCVQGQFWYSDETASAVAKEAVQAAGPSGRIACIACPSLFRQLRLRHPTMHAQLLEVDMRFEVRLCHLAVDVCTVACSHAPTLLDLVGPVNGFLEAPHLQIRPRRCKNQLAKTVSYPFITRDKDVPVCSGARWLHAV